LILGCLWFIPHPGPSLFTLAAQVHTRQYAFRTRVHSSTKEFDPADDLPWAEQVALYAPGDVQRAKSCVQAAAVKLWIQKVVVGHNLCPWASSAMQSQSLAFLSLSAQDEESLAKQLYEHAASLAMVQLPESDQATTMAVAPLCKSLADFDRFFGFCAWLDELFDEGGVRRHVQLAPFHPRFKFPDENGEVHPSNDRPDDFVSRAPFPAFHFLREVELEAAAETPEATIAIAEHNRNLLRTRGLSACRADLQACFDSIASDQSSGPQP